MTNSVSELKVTTGTVGKIRAKVECSQCERVEYGHDFNHAIQDLARHYVDKHPEHAKDLLGEFWCERFDRNFRNK